MPCGRLSHILMLVPVFLPHIGGVERHVDGVARELSARGYAVSILTAKHEPSLPDYEVRAGVHIYRLSYRSPRSVWLWLLKHFSLLRKTDIVHCHDFVAFYYWYLPFRFLLPQIPVYVTFHGFEAYPPERSVILRRRVTARLSNGYICVGRYISNWYRTPCQNIVLGATGLEVAEGTRHDKQSLVFLGRLVLDTAPADILKACRTLKEHFGISLKVDFCGDGRLRSVLEDYSARHGLSVTFHGFVTDVAPFLSKAGFALVTGYLSMLEAMACGAVVLAYAPNPLRKDYWSIAGLGSRALTVASTPDELAGHLHRLAQDPEEAAASATAGREFAKSQTWHMLVDQYLKLYGVHV